MYLKCIKAFGFKSFADKTELEFKPGITGIVGPNGSGKSNVVDAVRWVLGEQSIKALRGNSSMTDVIFAGSESRNPSTRASVALIFDNTDHYLNSEYNEIEVKRIVYKTGENEYYLNNQKVRLKDITDLFIDSGAGKESFNIISQGAVSDIILSKPEDRRVIFEEAAGVLKYKKRKEESLKKLDKTNENLTRITLLTDEINKTLLPLKDQSEKALKYQELKRDLESTEISVLAEDITKLNEEHLSLNNRLNELNNEINNYDLANSEDQVKIEQLKLKTLKLDETIDKLTNNLVSLEHDIISLSSQKQLIIERQKYQVDSKTLDITILQLEEEYSQLKKNLNLAESNLTNTKNNISSLNDKLIDLTKNYQNIKENKTTIEQKINNLNKEILTIENQIELKKSNLESDAMIPSSVRHVINNNRIAGVYNILSKIINVKDEYNLAIDVALGYNKNVVVVDNQEVAKNAITYLKENNLGRVTFFPLNVIKPKFIDQETLHLLQSNKEFIDVASKLVSCDKKYENIIENQLGNIVIVKDINALNKIGKVINYKYRIVSLTGEVISPGGAITGGTITSSTIKEKLALEELKNILSNKQILLNNYNKDLTKIYEEYQNSSNLIENINKELIKNNEIKNQQEILFNDLLTKVNEKAQELNGTKNMKESKLDKELKETIDNYYNKLAEKEIIDKQLKELKDNKFDISNEISLLEQKNNKFKENYNKLNNEIKNIEIKLGKIDVKLDNFLIQLNENYNLTYEKAKKDYPLLINIDAARLNVAKIKDSIKDLGEINIGSISEFERLNERYTFLTTQKEELLTSTKSLLDIIHEMDEIMIDRFKITFKQINAEFAQVFRKLFKGGHGELILTDENDMLHTGVMIKAEPPGKKLKNIEALSGGEMTLTSIALLFAILNVKPVPFCILDEIEAALDEANVDGFGKYLLSKKEKSQFIVITHKKRTMEYADSLYGITMQESGVSKLVSVKLEN